MKRITLAGMTMLALTVLTAIGCSPPPDLRDQRLADLARQSTEQQARQNEALSRQSQAVVEESAKLAETAQQLVQSDAEPRAQMVAVHERLNTQLNEQRASIDAGRDGLEAERKQIAQQRHRDPILAASIQTAGLIMAALLPLIICVYVIRMMGRTEPDDAAVAELLVTELTADHPVPLPGRALRPAPALAHRADPRLPGDCASDVQPDMADAPSDHCL